MNEKRKARPARIRVHLWETPASDAIRLELPALNMELVAIAFGVFFVMFAAVEWGAIASTSGRPVDDLFDLSFLMFQGFWVLGWSAGVLLLGAMTVLFAFYSESARIEAGRLVHVAKLGPVKILSDYELAKIRNVRVEEGSGDDKVRVRFDYDERQNALGDRGLELRRSVWSMPSHTPRGLPRPRARRPDLRRGDASHF